MIGRDFRHIESVMNCVFRENCVSTGHCKSKKTSLDGNIQRNSLLSTIRRKIL